ncbi:MAG: hypothetical protein LBT97_08850 [Planctomycetota bacterium]|jgi:hypothetical protein|nr:hypothetical protein [Planctomycetota bacterium]
MPRFFLRFIFAAVLFAPTASAVDVSRIPNGFANSKVGDWVKYRTIMGEQVMTLTSIENEGDNRVVKIQTDFFKDGEVINSLEDRIPLRSFFEAGDAPWAGNDVEIADAVVEFKGRRLDIVTIKNHDQNLILQMSAEIPLVGFFSLAAMGDEMPVMELVDFGRE